MLLKAGAEERHMDDKQYFNGMLNAQNAERFGLSFLFEKYYSAEQKIDKFIFNEMLELQNAAEARGISLVFFKGIIEKMDTYDDFSVKRVQKDIDLLVSLDNIYSFCKICEQSGYEYQRDSKCIPNSFISESLSRLSCHHLPTIYKKVLNGMLTISLEIHIAIDADWRIDKLNVLHSDGMIQRREKMKKYPQIYTLDVYDRLIVSLHHFSKHFLAGFLTYYYCPTSRLFDCKTLVDAYFIIKKYENIIDHKILKAKIQSYGFFDHIRFAVKMITVLFSLEDQQKFLMETILEEPFINSIKKNGINFAAQTLYAATESADELHIKTNLNFYKETVFRCIYRNEAVYAEKDKPILLSLKNMECSRISNITSQVQWTNEYLDFIFVMDVPFSFVGDIYDIKEGISIRIYNPDFNFEDDNAVRNIFICFDKVNNCIIPNITYNGAESFKKGNRELNRAYVMCDAELRHITFRIPWTELKIKVDHIDFIGLELMLNHGINRAKPQFYYYSNSSLPHHNPAKFGSIRFIR